MFGKLSRIIYKKTTPTRYTVIAASDNAALASELRQMLETKNHLVFPVTCANEALEFMDSVLPDVLICDFVDPEKNGRSFLNAVRIRLGKSIMPPVIFLRDDPMDERIAYSYGADDLLLKPCDPALLMATIKQVIAKRCIAAV